MQPDSTLLSSGSQRSPVRLLSSVQSAWLGVDTQCSSPLPSPSQPSSVHGIPSTSVPHGVPWGSATPSPAQLPAPSQSPLVPHIAPDPHGVVSGSKFSTQFPAPSQVSALSQ